MILDTYSNDYNVAEINAYANLPTATVTFNGANQTVKYLGQLATTVNGGDDTLRLGFEVHGSIGYNGPDAGSNVYSFQGTAGTQVWLDIDRTTYALDSQIDLLDANGNVLATAYASFDPATGNEIVPQFIAPGQFAAVLDPNALPPGNNGTTWTPGAIVNTTDDSWFVNNMYTENPKDAAMRVILPGPTGQSRTYYVRVSSHSGKSCGKYELQVRLQSTRVTPGSVVRYATIDYATNGVTVIGKPDHSPMEVQSFDYTTFNAGNQTTPPNTVQPIGQPAGLRRERRSTWAGTSPAINDVNWYSFTMDYNRQTGGSTVEIPAETRFPVIFDCRYDSGLARPDTVLWIFDSTGKLILKSTPGSDIVDQQVEPLQGANSGNLAHASYGTGDAYIGPVYLPANVGGASNTVYYVAVTTLGASSNSPTAPAVRYETVDSINQVADDNIGSQNANLLDQAPQAVLFPGNTTSPAGITELNTAAQPFTLGDVPLYVSTPTQLYTSDAYTGAEETQVSEPIPGLPYTSVSPFVSYGDIAMRNDGRLYGITSSPGLPPPAVNQNTWSGTLVQFDTGDASNAPISTQANGIITYRNLGALWTSPATTTARWAAST